MLNIFKKKKKIEEITIPEFEVELIAAVLAYEIARSDGEITEEESNLLINEIKKISEKVEKNDEEVLLLIEKHSNDSVSFHEFVEDINKDFSKEEKISLIE
ncbi:TerB family tellurite resistance protein, partial [Gammaproteobacteria bacterium]|nr:TerB family tellurite resistance protein [Gammaproteobacteria bacterium]